MELQIAQLVKKAAGGRTPLFAQLAGLYLQQGRAQDALNLCDAGLANFPYYSTGHLLKGKALVALHMRAEARREFEWVQEFLPGNETIIKLLGEIPPAPEETLTAPPTEVTTEFAPHIGTLQIAKEQPVTETAPDFGFGGITEAVPESAPASGAPMTESFEGFGAPPSTETVEATPASEAFGVGQPAEQTPGADNAFGLPSEPPAAPEFGTQEEAQTTEAFAGFGGEQPEGGFDFGTPTAEQEVEITAAPVEEEPFDQFAARVRPELVGENTMSLDDYLNSPAAGEAKASEIEDLAEKLQTAKRITPVVTPPTAPLINFAEKSVSTASEADTPASTGFVTPTLAEIYAKQGWYDDAIKAYKTLANNKPAERERFLKRIEELEELKKQQGT